MNIFHFVGSRGLHIWQADGRPMSGDIGQGTAHHAVIDFAGALLSDKNSQQLVRCMFVCVCTRMY